MTKIRAYKLAEELKIERDEFIKKAAELGIVLRSHMVNLEEDQSEFLRSRLGAPAEARREEKRLAGGTIIRRRRLKDAPDAGASAEPEIAAASAPAIEEAPETPSVLEEAATPDELVSAGPSKVEPAPTVVEPPAGPAPAPQPAAAEAAPAAAAAPGRPAPRAPVPLVDESEREVKSPAGFGESAGSTGGGGAAGPARRQVRRTVTQEMNLREQDTMARTMLGNVQRRLEQRRIIVEHQSRMAPSRRVRSRDVARPSTAERKTPLTVKLGGGDTTLKEISRQSGIKIRELWRRARAAGIEVERDDRIDFETATLLGTDLGFEVELVRSDIEVLEQNLASAPEPKEADVEPRPPVVTVMGHVDHGKTSLLDYIRKSNVVAGEAGGITQHIGAYTVQVGAGSLTFIDTPGHAAFTNMRARGAQVTDIVVLVVAADDGVMPQTVEAIDHARAAGVPIIVAVNKIDKPTANPSRVKQDLLSHQIVAEDFGGDTIMVEVSATKGTGVDKLLEMLALQAEVLELKAPSKGSARGVVVEAQLDRGRGAVATVLVREGQLERGDAVVIGNVYGRVRSMTDHQGAEVKRAGPSVPVQLVGLSGVPEAGDELVAVKNEREAKAVVEHRLTAERRAKSDVAVGAENVDIFGSLDGDGTRELRIVLKADVHGTMEAVREGISNLSTDRVSVKIIHTGVGGISESDVMLASASRAVVAGFHVRPEPAARKAAEREKVEIRCFDIVYELFDDMKLVMGGLLPPKIVETVVGHARVKELFPIPKFGTIVGCQIDEGSIKRNNPIRVLRDGVPIYTGKIESLRRFRDDVREVSAPLECGVKIENFNDVKVGDVLESLQVEERPDSL
jgi:translation initiation factor IF-2